jgi:hypothetical protein
VPVTIPDALTPVFKSPYPFRPRLLFILRRRPDASREAFTQTLRDWRRRKEFGVESGSIIARAGAAMVEEQEIISGRFRAGGIEVTPLDGYVSLDMESYDPTPAEFDTMLKAANGCLDTLAGVINPAESIAFAGIANLAIPGFAPISMILILDRAKGLSLKQYNEWWVRHGDDHRRMNPAQVGYHQLHIAPEFNALAAKAAGVATTDRCIIDHMYLRRPSDGFSDGGDPSSEENLALWADIDAHVSMAAVSGSFMQEV